ncbi:WD repeat-containing protein 73 [Merluccius polli]|uniref:WD repeat-containing protein 73 n=1 Tax=Merluccius polli TaxID=89951 RepID=A0AA47MJ42_MERPO|nr:WD repeat-containing protein 73 [Merluccius polli]
MDTQDAEDDMMDDMMDDWFIESLKTPAVGVLSLGLRGLGLRGLGLRGLGLGAGFNCALCTRREGTLEGSSIRCAQAQTHLSVSRVLFHFRYKDLYVYHLDHPTRVIEWTSEKTICVAGFGSGRNEILELHLPPKLFADENKGLCAQRDFKVVHGGFTDGPIHCLRHIPGTRCVVTNDGRSSSLQVWDVGGDESDVIRRTSSIEVDAADPPGLAEGERGSQVAAGPTAQPSVLHGSLLGHVQLTRLASENTCCYTLETESSEPLSSLQFVSPSVFLACCRNGNLYAVDTRNPSLPPPTPVPPPAAVPMDPIHWCMDASAGGSSPDAAGCRVARLSSSAEVVVSDLRYPGSPTHRALLDIRTDGSALDHLRVSWAPALEDCVAVSVFLPPIHNIPSRGQQRTVSTIHSVDDALLPPPETPDGGPEPLRSRPEVVLHGLTELLPCPGFCLGNRHNCAPLGLPVPACCLRSPTGQKGPIGLLLQFDGIPHRRCPPAGSGIAATAGTDHLAATALVGRLNNGGVEHGPLRLNVPRLPRYMVKALPEVGVEALSDRRLCQTFPADPHDTFGSARSDRHSPPPSQPTHHQVVIRFDGGVQIFSMSTWGPDAREQQVLFQHRDHSLPPSECSGPTAGAVRTTSHAWHPDRPHTLLSAATDGSVHVWDWVDPRPAQD